MPTPVLFPKPKVVRDIEQIRKEQQGQPQPGPGPYPKPKEQPQQQTTVEPGTGARTPETVKPFETTPGVLILKKPESKQPPKPGASYETIKGKITDQLTEARQQQLTIFMAPPGAYFYDKSGKRYTKEEALASLEIYRASLKEQKAQVSSYEEFGYHVKAGEEPGTYEFYRTPEEVKESMVKTKMEKLDVLYREDKIAGVGHVISTGLLSWEDPFSIRSGLAYATGGQEAFLRVKAEASLGLDYSTREPLSFGITLFASPLATLGTAFVFGAGANVLEQTVTKTAQYASLEAGKGAVLTFKRLAPQIYKVGMYGAGIAIGGAMAVDIAQSYERDPFLAVAKGLTYAGAFAMAMKGYEMAGGGKAVSIAREKGAEKFYTEHPERIRFYSGELGVKESTLNLGGDKADIFMSKGTPREITRIRTGDVTTYSPGGGEIATTTKPGASMEFKGISGAKVRTGELIDTGGIVQTKPLVNELRYSTANIRSGEINTTMGKRIIDFKLNELRYLQDLSSRELGGSGGFTQTTTIPIPEEAVSVMIKPPLFTSTPGGAGIIAPVLMPPIHKGITIEYGVNAPVFKPEVDLEREDMPVFQFKPKSAKEPGFGELPVFDVAQDQSFKQGQIQEVALEYALEFDSGLMITNVPKTPIFEETERVTPGVPFPRGLFLTGNLDSGDFAFMRIFGRTRKFKPGNLEKAFNVGVW